MKLSELRDHVANGGAFIPLRHPTSDEAKAAAELVADIDGALGSAKLAGWRSALEAVRERITSRLNYPSHTMWSVETLHMLINKMLGGQGVPMPSDDAPEPLPAPEPAERLSQLYDICLRLITRCEALEQKQKELAERDSVPSYLRNRLGHLEEHKAEEAGRRLALAKRIEHLEKGTEALRLERAELARRCTALERGEMGPGQCVPDMIKQIASLEKRAASVDGAPADSPLGVELSKIRDRLNALETAFASILCSTAVIPWPADVLGRIEKLETAFASIFKRAEYLEGRVQYLGDQEKLTQEVLSEHEHKIEKLTP